MRGSARRRVSLGGLAAALLSCALLAPAAANAQPPADYYGLNVQPVFESNPLFVGPASWDSLFTTVAGDGIDTARTDFQWKYVEPKAPVNGQHTYVWNNPSSPQTSPDAIVTALAQAGIRVEVVLDLPPSWASGPGTNMAPAYYSDFEAYAAAVAARYGPGGSFWASNPQLPDLPIEQFEIWDEANSDNFWSGAADAAAYEPVLVATSNAIHAVDPGAIVMPSIGWQNAASYVSQLYQLGVQGSIQGIAFHPYGPNAPGIVALVQQVRGALQTSGDPQLPIYATEIGLPVTQGEYTDPERAGALSLAGDALAHSDCGLQSYSVFAIVGSNTSTSVNGLGDGSYFGVFDSQTFAPNVTGQALIAAIERWQTDPGSGLVLCGSGPTPTQQLLPLTVTLTHASPTCVTSTIDYQGNPVWGAQLVLTASNNRVDTATAGDDGTTPLLCVDANGPNITHFGVYAEASSPNTTASLSAPNMALSASYTCDTNPADPCVLSTSAPSGGGTVPPSGSGGSASAVSNGFRLLAKLVRIDKHSVKLRAELLGTTAAPPPTRLSVLLEAQRSHGRPTTKKIASVMLSGGQWCTFSAHAKLVAGDRLILRVSANDATGLAALQATLDAPRAHAKHTQHTRRL